MTIEQKNQRLNEIIAKLEDKSTTLDEATQLYNEGVEIFKSSIEQLNITKGKITEIKEIVENIENDINED